MTTRLRKKKRSRRGQGLVEFTIMFPLILMMFLGMVELGWWVQSWISVATAARDGARYGTRGLHVNAQEIAEVTEVTLSSTLELVLVNPGSNVKIIVTQIDVEPDGSFVVYDTYEIGEFAVSTSVCTVGPCPADSIDVLSISASNKAFNDNVAFCDDTDGCRADIVIVEAIYDHRFFFPLPILTQYLSEAATVDGRGIMRVAVSRDS